MQNVDTYAPRGVSMPCDISQIFFPSEKNISGINNEYLSAFDM